jgi:hypothetical protein
MRKLRLWLSAQQYAWNHRPPTSSNVKRGRTGNRHVSYRTNGYYLYHQTKLSVSCHVMVCG